MSRYVVVLCAALLSQALFISPVRAAQLTATWNPSINGGDGVSYNDPANWDINQVPINNVTDTFVVVIPTGNSVTYNAGGIANTVDELTLGSGGTLNMASPGFALIVSGAADISGNVTGDNGSLTANALTSSMTGRTRLTALNGGDITIAAPSINFNAVANGGETIFQATGTGSTINLTAATTLQTTENSSFEDPAVIFASDSGAIDLSGVNTASANDRMIFRVRTGGAIDLSALQSTSRVNFDVGDSSTQNANAMTSFDSGNVMLGTMATINATSLASFTNSSFDAEQNAVFNAPMLTDITGSTLTLAPDFTFTTGSISNIDNARIFVESGKNFAAVSALTYNMSTGAGARTILEADGPGSVLSLTSLTSMVVNETSSFEDPQTVRATDSGVVDLSNVLSAASNDLLTFHVETAGNINLNALQTTNRVRFDVDIASYTLPALVTGNNTRFDVGANNTLTVNAMTTQDGGSVTLDNNSTLNATSLTTLRNTTFTALAGATFNTPGVTDLQGSTLTLDPGFTFTIGSVSNIDNARFFIQGGKTFNSVSATSYDGAFNNPQTIMEADSTGSVLDLSTLLSFDVTESTSFEDELAVVAKNNGSIDLSGVVSASANDLLTFRVQSGGSIDLSSLTSTDRVNFDVDITSYTLPVLVTTTNSRYDVGPSSTLNLPMLMSHTGGSFTLGDSAVLNANAATSVLNTTVNLGQNSTLNVPSVTNFAGSTITLTPDSTFNAGVLSNIDGSRFFLAAGASFSGVTATTYTGTFSNAQVILEADGLDSVLDLSSLTSIQADENTSFEDALTIRAANSGLIDLSSLDSLTSNDLVQVQVQTGGNVDLSALTSTNRVLFDVDVTSYTLPALLTTTNSRYDVDASSTLNLPVLTSHNGGAITLGDTATLNANAATSITNTTLSLAQNSVLNATSVTNFAGSTVTITADNTFNSGSLSNIDGSRFFVTAGGSFSNVTATTYNGTKSGAQVIFEADGLNSMLDLSSLTSVQVDENTSFEDVLTIRAANNGFIDLSSLDSLASNDRVQVQLQSGGDIDLDSLSSVSRGLFDIDITTYDLPALASASATIFDINNGSTLNLPMLTAATGSTIGVGSLGVFNAPLLTDFNGSFMTVTGNNTVTTGPLSDIDNARFTVNSGGVFNSVAATTYNSTFSGSQTIIDVDGTGSELDLSSLISFVANDNTSFSDTLTVLASNNGKVDLSSVTTASTNDDNVLQFKAETGGTIDLSKLVSTQNVRYQVESGGMIHSGDVQAADNTVIVVTDLGSVLDFSGDLKMGSAATANVSTGAELHVGGDFSHEQTTEANVDLDAAVVRLDGAGGQLLDVAGEDLGLPGPGSGNFGIGQLVIGTTTQRTSVDLVDVIDNGNRGGSGEAEALYLYGLGGPDGLRILNNSALVLNGLNVYAWDSAMAQMVHINDLFMGGDLRIEYDDGFIQLTPLDFQWDNILGGDFNVPTNWNDNLVPLASDSALWNLGSVLGYEVVFGTNVATDSAVIKTDRVTFDLNGFTYTNAALNATTGVVVGQGPGDNAHLTVIDGTLAGASATVAADAGSTGVLVVENGGVLDVGTLTLGPGDSTATVDTGGEVKLMTLDANRGDFDVLGGAALVGTGTVGAAGTYTQTTDGTLAVTLDNTPLTPDSPVEVSGDAFLDGGLDLTQQNVAIGDSFDVFIASGAGGITGAFDNAQITGTEIDATHALAVLYVDTGDADALVDVVRVFATLNGDTNGDGTVSLIDLDALGVNFGSNGGWAEGDFNYDGAITLLDLDAIGVTFGTSITAPASPTVPEPASLALLAIGGLALVRRRYQSMPIDRTPRV